jgi:carbon-monoxide dehydrogenase medium subunit
MKLWNSYHNANSIEDALAALARADGETCVVAGGTDLLLDMQQGRHAPVDCMVDVSAVPEMQALEVRQQHLFIGAAVPISRIVRSPLVREHAEAVMEACDLIGGPQVRNSATLGGNVAHALPAADGTISLMAMGARAEVASRAERRMLPMEALFIGPGQSSLETGAELLVGFYLPLRATGQASAFQRVMRPQGVALPILNAAAWLWREGDMIRDIRLAFGPSGPTPRRAEKAEAVLRDSNPDAQVLEQARAALLSEAHFRTSKMRATADYRRHLAGDLLNAVVETAWVRAAV